MKFTPIRDLSKAKCIRLEYNIELAGEMVGGAPGTTCNALFPAEDPGLRLERKAGTLIVGRVLNDTLFEVEVPLNHIVSITHAALKADAE